MPTGVQQANPLTLWIPVKQGFIPQLLVKILLWIVLSGKLLLNFGNFLHFFRFTRIPNNSGKGVMGMLLVTDFDQPMTPYLNFFYNKTRLKWVFKLLYIVAVKTPPYPESLSVFEQYLNANNLSPIGSLSFAYNASVSQILEVFPPSPKGSHANPLTVWIPVKQDRNTQLKVTKLLTTVKGGGLIKGNSNLMHYYRTVGIPNNTEGNRSILISAEFDGPVDAFLDYFYTLPGMQRAFTEIYSVAVNPPQLPDNLASFKQYINAHNLATAKTLTYAYRATVAQIVKQFPPAS